MQGDGESPSRHLSCCLKFSNCGRERGGKGELIPYNLGVQLQSSVTVSLYKA